MELINDDCLIALKDIPDNSMDIVITSPPYNMNLRVNNGKYISRCSNKNYKKEFSSKYNNYNDDLSVEDYFNFQKSVISECLRVSNLLFYNIQMVTGNKKALMMLLGYFADNVKEIIIWNKINSQPAMHEQTLNSQFEFIIVFEKEKPYNRSFDKANFERGTLSNIWNIKREVNKEHKASFPQELVEKILLNFTNEGDNVLDVFMGSGTTGVACQKLNRNFTGIEIDEHYFNIAKNKIEIAGMQQKLF